MTPSTSESSPPPSSYAPTRANPSTFGGGYGAPDLSKTFIATNRVDVPTTHAGWAQALVKVLDDVKKDQEVVTVYDSWGDVVERVRAPADSRVLQVKTDPAVEQGSVVIVLVNNATDT